MSSEEKNSLLDEPVSSSRRNMLKTIAVAGAATAGAAIFGNNKGLLLKPCL